MEQLIHRARWMLALIIFGLAFIFAILSAMVEATRTQDFTDWTVGLFQNFATEALGAGLILLVVEQTLSKLQSEIQQQLETQRTKEQLIREMRNPDNGIALRAVEELKARHWHTDGSLVGQYLGKANLRGVELPAANLSEAILFAAHLEDAQMEWANLHKASLYSAFLTGANLRSANLREANLWVADLEGANLLDTDLEGADLTNTKFDRRTLLPDDEGWTPETDMRKFTDPHHPDFWCSDDRDSPAYRGKTKSDHASLKNEGG